MEIDKNWTCDYVFKALFSSLEFGGKEKVLSKGKEEREIEERMVYWLDKRFVFLCIKKSFQNGELKNHIEGDF